MYSKYLFRKTITILFAMVFLIIPCFNAIATDGSLDTTFGTGGKVVTAIGSRNDTFGAIAILSTGINFASENRLFPIFTLSERIRKAQIMTVDSINAGSAGTVFSKSIGIIEQQH